MKNKRGSHVGIILSFVIFVTFLVFLYVVVQPALSGLENKRVFLDYLKMKLIENASENFTIASVNIVSIKNPTASFCIKFEDLTEKIVEIKDSRLVVKDENKAVIPFYVSTSKKELEVTRNSVNHLFFRIFDSPTFKIGTGATTPSCRQVKKDEYIIGLVTTDMYIFNTSILEIKTAYETDYEKLKRYFKIPVGRDFGFSFTDSTGTKVFDVGEGVQLTSIFAEEIPIQYVDEKANILPGFINIKVW